jgi:hypothetical protein
MWVMTRAFKGGLGGIAALTESYWLRIPKFNKIVNILPKTIDLERSSDI